MSNKPKSIHDVGEMVGIPRRTTDEILDEIRANKAKLGSCSKPHDFSICLDRRTKKPTDSKNPLIVFACYWGCSKCGGWVDSTARSWYDEGLAHARDEGIP